MQRTPLPPERKDTKAPQGGAPSRLLAEEGGVTAIEYTLIAALIAVAAVLLIATIGGEVAAPFGTVAASL